MAFSSGFHPHPRISYVNAAPTGAASEAEYVEIGLAEQRDPELVLQALNSALPDGLVIVEVAESSGGSLAERLGASRWLVQLPGATDEIAAALAALNASEQVLVARQAKSGLRAFDVRTAVLASQQCEGGFEVTLAIGEPLVRPDDVVAALRQLHPDLETGTPALYTRLAQGPWDGAVIGNPLVKADPDPA